MINLKYIVYAILLFTSHHSMALSHKEAKKWSEDITVYKNELQRRHIDLYHSISQKAFQDQLEQLKSELPNLNKYQVIIRLMKITRLVGNGLSDGHTSVPLWGRDYHLFPFDLVIQNGHALVVATTEPYKALLGSQLKSINSIPIEQLIPKFSKIVPFVENSYSEQIRVGHKLLTAELLFGLGFIDNLKSTTLVFENKNGYKTVNATSMTHDQYWKQLNHKLDYKKQEVFKKVHKQSDSLWFASLNQGKIVYIYFRLYPSMPEMQSFAKKILQYLNKQKTKNLIIDFRDSFGGNGFVGLKLAEYLIQADSINWKSGVYTLISNKTFSAAINNSIQYRQLLNAKLVGQASGGRPSGYQDMGQFNLPNSNLLITYSKRLFDFPYTKAPALFPDILVPLHLSDYSERKDRTLEWVLLDIQD